MRASVPFGKRVVYDTTMRMPDREIITSRDNQHVKHARRVREGLEAGSMFVEGTRLVEELLRSDVAVANVFVSAAAAGNGRIAALVGSLTKSGTAPVTVAERIFDQIAATKNPQGIIAVAVRPSFDVGVLAGSLVNSEIPVVVLLHSANDPSNVGSVVRTAEAAGAAGVILTRGSADPYSPKALRASMGSAFRIPIVSEMSIEDAVDWASGHGLLATGADVNAETLHYEADWTRPRLLMFGSEAHGLSESERELAAELIKIPLSNAVESLNLAVSSGIILFEAKRRRQ